MDPIKIPNRLSAFFACNVLVLLGLVSSASAETFDIKSCKVTFETTGSPVLVKIQGSSKKPCVGKITVEGGAIKANEITMDLSELDTGIGLRNKHLRENYLHVEKFPKAIVKLTEAINLATQLQGNAKKSEAFSGTLNLHGKDAPITKSEYIFDGSKKVTAKFSVNLNDHGVDYPSFMGVKVVDVVHLTVAIEL